MEDNNQNSEMNSNNSVDQSFQESQESFDNTEQNSIPQESEQFEQPEVNSNFQDNVVPQEEVVKAKRYGHKSKEQWIAEGRDPKLWKDEKSFNNYGDAYSELRDTIQGLHSEIKKRDKDLEVIVKSYRTVQEQQYARAKAELSKQLEEAKQMGDIDAVEHLTRENQKIDYQEAQQRAAAEIDNIEQIKSKFLERNASWFNKDMEMTKRAQEIDAEIRSGVHSWKYPTPTNYEQFSRQIEQVLRDEFPDRFRAQQTRTAPTLSPTNSQMNKPGVDSDVKRAWNSLSEEDKNVFRIQKRTLEKCGIQFTEKDFIEQQRKFGVL